ncbi:MAG: hypothetical protein QOH57_1594 [Mycobacterium sp.]|jgi:hypothetical protein|nr:hypothetical protein [Mycobacterium sp.]
MRRYSQDPDRQDAPVAGVTRPAAQRAVEAQLLALQQAAGNSAVSAGLSRDPGRLTPFAAGAAAVVQRSSCCAGCAGGGSCESETAAPAEPETESNSNADEAASHA